MNTDPPLRHVVCPDCNIKFGVDENELRFMEQTKVTLWCPRGHKLKSHSHPMTAYQPTHDDA